MQYIYKMQNLTFGEDGGLTAACQAKHPDAPGLCFMSPHMVDAIQTPVFAFNSKCVRERLNEWHDMNLYDFVASRTFIASLVN
jgi:hypothetical protein